jgi:FKBP-type peptidyl-prolyl cis-trans isomerase
MSYIKIGLLTILVMTSVSCEAAKVSLKSKEARQSYAIGQSIGKSMKQQNAPINSDALAKGIKDALAGKSDLTDQEIQEVMALFQKAQIAKQQKQHQSALTKNQKEADSFLAKNKSKKGVITTKSGLQYKVDKRGRGKQSPKATDTVVVHYKGSLIDGTEFDSSYKRNQPATFPVSGVIPGWTEALQLMKTGDEFTLYVPPKLGYGE